MKKLNQVLAIEKGIRTQAYSALTELHKAAQKAELFEGFNKTYQPLGDDGKRLPPEAKKVQFSASSVIEDVKRTLADLFDVTAAKDFANCSAKADVVIDSTTLLTGVPATYLLFLEKQLTDLQTFVTKLAELDSSIDWSLDPTTGNYKSPTVETHRTEKLQEAIVLYPATPEHPAQTQLITKDQLVGHWSTQRFSGAIPRPRKNEILVRITKLLRATKVALEQANTVEAADQKIAEKVFSFLFSV